MLGANDSQISLFKINYKKKKCIPDFLYPSAKLRNFGKAAQGLKVQLRFDAYPYQETGYVSGTPDYLSSVSVDSMFLGTVRLDNGLLTSQNKTIQFKSGLKAGGLIITKELRLPERLYYAIIKSDDYE